MQIYLVKCCLRESLFFIHSQPSIYNNVEDLTERVLHEARVFITPGFIFGSNGQRYVRISLCAKEDKMTEALERIRQALHA